MAITFTGPEAFKFLGFTPKATDVLQKNPTYLVILLVVLLSMIGIGLLAYTIHLITNKDKPKPQKAPPRGAKK